MSTELQHFRLGFDGLTVQLRADFDDEAGKHLIFWDDVEFAFPGVHCVKSGSTIVSFARDKRRRRIEPLCIAYEPNIVLEVVMTDTPSPASSTTVDTRYEDVESTGRIEEIDSSSTESVRYSFPSGKSDFSIDNVHIEKIPCDNEDCLSHMPTPRQNGPAPPIPERLYPINTFISPQIPERPYAPTRTYVPPPSPHSTASAVTTIAAVETSNTTIVTSVLSFEQSIREGQIIQAKVLKQEADSIKQEMSIYYEGLHSEVAKNSALQSQMLEMQAAADKMTRRILQLQEAAMATDKRMLEMQQKALDRLALIHSKTTAILLQTYELHEYPIPRLFIILPKEDTTRREKLTTLFVKRFRLYFLCECGEHTKPNDGSESNMSHEIHLARHEGYDLDRPNEFFRKYGSYVLALLQMLKYGVAAAGMVVSPLSTYKVCEGLGQAEKSLKYLEKNIAPMVDNAIKYLEGLFSVQDGTTRLPEDGISNTSATTLVEPVIMSKLEALEGADLRQLRSFLKDKDEAKVLGNLYRTVTSEGHVKWVCLDHYRETYRASALMEFRNNLEANNGEYDDRRGRVTIRLSSALLAQQFYSILDNTRFVQELAISMTWDTSMDDFRILKYVIQRSIIYHLDINSCGFSGSTFDIVNRGRRWEPILQMMGNSKLGIVAVRNMPGFLLRSGKMPATLQIRVLDMSEQLTLVEEFSKLRKLLLAAPNLSELSLLIPSICEGFDLVKQLTGDIKQLSALSVKRQDGSTASFSFKKGSGEVTNTELSICTFENRRIFQLPMVTALSLFGSTSQSVDTILAALRAFRQLKSLDITCSPKDFLRVLLFVYQNLAKDSHLGLLTLRNAERDTIITGRGLPVTDLDFGDFVVPVHAFDALRYVLITCTQLEALALITHSLAGGIEFVRRIDVLKGALRNLTVRQPNWSKADVVFVPGAGEVESIKLRICDLDSREILDLPNVKHVTIFEKDRNTASTLGVKHRELGILVSTIISSYPSLTTVEFLGLNSDAKEALKGLLQSADDFSKRREQLSDDQTQDVAQGLQDLKAISCSMVDLPGEFVILGKAFLAVHWILYMSLIISSADASSDLASDSSVAATLTFSLVRSNGSLASVRIDADINYDSPILFYVCDFASSDSSAPASGSSLAIVSKRSTIPLDDLILAATKRCHGLASLAVVILDGCMTYPSFLRMLGTVHEAARQRPTLRVFKDWGLERSKRMGIFSIPVTYLDTTRQAFTNEELPILDKLLNSCHHLSQVAVLVAQVWEAFQTIKKASLLHKRLSKVQFRHHNGQVSLALVTVAFSQNTGEVVDISVHVRSFESPKLFLLPKVTSLTIEGCDGANRMEEMVLQGLGKFQEVHTLMLKTPKAQFIQSLVIVQKAMLEPRLLTKVEIWGFVDNNTKSAFNLPLTHLDLSQRVLLSPELTQLANVLEVNPAVKSLLLQVSTVHKSLDILRQIAKHLRTLTHLTLACPDGSGAVVEFEETGGHITTLDLHLPMDTSSVSQPTDLDSSDKTGDYTALQTRQLLDLSDNSLKALESAQQAAMGNPFMRHVTLLNGNSSPIVYDIPILQLSSGSGKLSVKDDIPKINRLIGFCSDLTVLDFLVPAIGQALTTVFSLVKDVEERSKISSIVLRQEDGSRATISLKTVTEHSKWIVLTLRLLGSFAPPLPNSSLPPAPLFSILRMPIEMFETLVTALITFRESWRLNHQINITDSNNVVLSTTHLPIRSLDFGSVVVTKEDTSRLERILEITAYSLNSLKLFVNNLDEDLHFILPVLNTYKNLSTVMLKHVDGAKALFEFQPGTDTITSVSLKSPNFSLSTASTLGAEQQGRKVNESHTGPAIAIGGGDEILRLKNLSDSELRFFAAIQEWSNQPSCLRIRDFHNKDSQATITIPVLKVNLVDSLSEDEVLVLARLLSYCPLLSEVAITVDDLESAVIPFIKTLPERLKDLSVLSVRQSHTSKVSYYRTAVKERNEAIEIQVDSLAPGSDLFKLSHVKELTLLSTASDSLNRVAEISVMVKVAKARFPELESLRVYCKLAIFNRVKTCLDGLSETSSAPRFDMYLVDSFNYNQFTWWGVDTGSGLKQRWRREGTGRMPHIVDTRGLLADEKTLTLIHSMIKRQPLPITTPSTTHLIIYNWDLHNWEWKHLLEDIDYLTLRYLSFPGSKFADRELEMLVSSIHLASNRALKASTHLTSEDRLVAQESKRTLADLKVQQEKAKKETDGGGFDVGPLMVYLDRSHVTHIMMMVQQERLQSYGIEWCRLTMEDGAILSE
ncbi:hypothetical protein BGZ96_002341 [Linnemannia gamsii]|uniref:Uncharacterized protein n=1 Tax=Linnemannia gamsii TaxID=64522 RepID=A0ABQ7K863_9FUNG|nr:hypothetical protein BGZ96_002341 [Linnemannia gamsii]